MNNSNRTCVRCVMSTGVDKNIYFDYNGLCNHCQRYDKTHEARLYHKNPEMLDQLADRIKKRGKGKSYDCLIGVSGGVDSTFVALFVKELGLRPLAVHVDNGWNSEQAVQNIYNCLNMLDIDLHTVVLNWEEFKSLQIAFLKAGVPDGEVPSDHAIFASMWKMAVEFGIPTIISGMNYHTESISVPNWSYGHSDFKYINFINKRYGSKKLRTFPHFSLWYLLYINAVRRIRTVSILNYVSYDKEQIKARLIKELGWIDYGGKHHESIYTRFYQGHYLPKYHGIDKRFGHYSDLINAGQLSKETAFELLSEQPYPLDEQLRDVGYVASKFRLTTNDFLDTLSSPKHSYKDFPNQEKLLQSFKFVLNFLRKQGLYPR